MSESAISTGAIGAESLGIGATDAIQRLERSVARVVRGKDEVIRLAVVSLLAGGHVLIEDVPGVGKTTLAQALASALGLSFQRIQFTSDLLPSDILGVSIYNQQESEFRFTPGPLFANVVLADEINRASPKTQSALLEAMSEGRVSIDRERYTLPQPFLVLATQNPLEHQGTFPLPESQLDRFLMSLELGYPSTRHEKELLQSGGVEGTLASMEAVLDQAELLTLQGQIGQVLVAEKLVDYMLAIAEITRSSPDLRLGVSTRGLQGLYRAAQALAYAEGRGFAIPEDVQRLAVPVLGHRVVAHPGGGSQNAKRLLDRLMRSVPVPV